ncbi:hypothetical protein A2U01_0082917, partial [Trifolium medium]|nr:hypothetical protein [Trifolium medium]
SLGGTSLADTVVVSHHATIFNRGGPVHNGLWNRCNDPSRDRSPKLATGDGDT